jgi:hypothetical protein
MKIFDKFKPVITGWFIALGGGIWFADGLRTGKIELSTRTYYYYHPPVVARATSPFWFWVLESGLLGFAIVGAIAGTGALIRISRGLPEAPSPPPPPRRLPESLAELVHTHRIAQESVPRLLKELQPQLGANDRLRVLHSRTLEAYGIIMGSFCVVAMIGLLWVTYDTTGRILAVAIFGTLAAGFPAGCFSLAASWRRRRQRQMEWILKREAFYRDTHK